MSTKLVAHPPIVQTVAEVQVRQFEPQAAQAPPVTKNPVAHWVHVVALEHVKQLAEQAVQTGPAATKNPEMHEVIAKLPA